MARTSNQEKGGLSEGLAKKKLEIFLAGCLFLAYWLYAAHGRPVHADIFDICFYRRQVCNDALLNAAAQNDYDWEISSLITRGADVNAKGPQGFTALMIAASKGLFANVKALLAAGAQVNAAVEADGMTALMSAAFNGHTDTVNALLVAGASVNAKNADGMTALILAAFKGHTDTVTTLLTAGADVNAMSLDGLTALTSAALEGHTETVEALLTAGVDLDVKTPDGESQGMRALRNAVSPGFAGAVRALVEAGVAAKATSDERAALLRSAEKKGKTAVVRLLKETWEPSAAVAGNPKEVQSVPGKRPQEWGDTPPQSHTPATEQTYRLTVRVNPEDSRIRFLNTNATYTPGMRLRPGDYRLQIKRDGYETKQQRITVNEADVMVELMLQKTPATSAVITSPPDASVSLENPHKTQTPALTTTGSLSPVVTARRLALVIGNAAYETGALRNPGNDATDMAATLERLGFQVTLLRDAPKKKMEEEVTLFSQQLHEGGVGLFYFAGHGVQVEGQNYLIPVGARLAETADVKYRTVAAGWVLERMEEAGNEMNMMILDACRDNPFKRQWRSSEGGLAAMQSTRGTLIAYATAPGGVADDGTGRNGLYTQHLLRYMTEPGLKIEQVFKRVRGAVAQETKNKQIPWESSSLMGDFYFANTAPAQ